MVAYRLNLPDELSQIHNTFGGGELWKCVSDESTIISLCDIQVEESLNYVEKPIVVLDRNTKALCNKDVKPVKVQWQHWRGSEWTWQPEDEMRKHYPDLFASADFEDEV
ncbi:uncharacterized protein LOC111908497 [Lactuca sativa]|uniref:uncharacterized protein LOC111908497 n=1 Tax=Lactuca sativa TaxID=4236 RepID=UPI000CD88F32|nr:uncharacterized protein LOC111908497 [Lactuca sativa]